MLESFQNANISLIEDKISNFSYALNAGWRSAKNEVIGIVNDDIVFGSDWIKNAKTWFNRLSDAKSIGGVTYDMIERKMTSVLKKNTRISKIYDVLVTGGKLFDTGVITEWGSYSIGNTEPVVPKKVSGFSGANMIFLKSVLQEIGGFRTIFKYAGSEGYAYIQLLQRGENVYLVPGCSVRHYPNPNGGTRSPFYLAQDYAVFLGMLHPSTILGKIRKILNELSFFLFWLMIYKNDLRKFSILMEGYLAGIKLYKKHPDSDMVA